MQGSSRTATRKDYISVLNVLSCLAVVMLHMNGCFWGYSQARWWETANAIECVFYFGVPVFFMLSGATLIDYRKRYDTKTFFKKRAEKILLPFLFWTAFSMLYYYLVWGEPSRLTIGVLIDAFINYRYMAVYWFFIPLFAAYLCIPVISLIPEDKRRVTFKYIIILGFLMNNLLPYVVEILRKLGATFQYNNEFSMPLATNYLIYYFLGYYLDHYEIKKSRRICIYVAGVAALLFHMVGTSLNSHYLGQVSSTLKGYHKFPSVMYGAAVFLAVKQLCPCIRGERTKKLLHQLEGTTFGVYLIHKYFVDTLTHWQIVDMRSTYIRLFGGVALFVVTSAIVWLLKKIPVLKKLV